MNVGERIKQRRIEMNLTQDELAKKVGYKSRSSINKIELSRDLPLTKVTKVAKVLDCTPAYLMGWENENIEEITNIDVKLTEMNEKVKEYALKMNRLSEENKKYIMYMIDLAEKFERDERK